MAIARAKPIFGPHQDQRRTAELRQRRLTVDAVAQGAPLAGKDIRAKNNGAVRQMRTSLC